MSVLKRIHLVFTLSCRDASRLLSERTERRLAIDERLALGIHLGLCRACRRFRRYLRTLDAALRGDGDAADDASTRTDLMTSLEGDAALSDDAKQRLKRRLEQA